MAVPLVRKRFTTHDFHRMAEAGIIGEDDRYELIAGEIVEMAAIGSKHSACVTTCTQICYERLGRSVVIIVQGPIQLGPDYEPQPDLIIARQRTDNYRENNPTPEDILLLLEVADSSFAYDQTVKMPIYAAAGILEVWLVDLNRQRILRYSEPHEGNYKIVRQFRPGRQITSVVVPELSVATGAIFGL